MNPAPALALLCAACIATAPPGLPPRCFDPAPAFAPVAGGSRSQPLPPPRVSAAPYLGQAFVLRIGPRELQFDDRYRWSARPEELVSRSLDRALFGNGAFTAGSGDGAHVYVERFELDLQGEPRAVVVLQLTASGRSRECAASAPAAARSPEALAEAMATALQDAVQQLAAALRP
ncbi:MAG TPA: ABC-type transport auxiliary lipoprotein family protein [Planctomycetota bacterium]|nr:ABC-type transport auxiliary lipoprotein family protein [Planctomycetota bacterium]